MSATAAASPQGNPIGAVVLESCYAEAGRPTGDEGGDKYFTFKVVFDAADSRDYELACETEELMLAWMKVRDTARLRPPTSPPLAAAASCALADPC